MKKTLTMAAVALGLILTSAAAMAEDTAKPAVKDPQQHGDKHRPDRFAEADKNNDGFITKEEMTAAQKAKMDKMFADLDTDKDSKLSKAEMEAGKKQMREKMKAHWNEKKAKGEVPPAKGPAPDGTGPSLDLGRSARRS